MINGSLPATPNRPERRLIGRCGGPRSPTGPTSLSTGPPEAPRLAAPLAGAAFSKPHFLRGLLAPADASAACVHPRSATRARVGRSTASGQAMAIARIHPVRLESTGRDPSVLRGAEAHALAAGRSRLVHRRLLSRPEPDASDSGLGPRGHRPRGRALQRPGEHDGIRSSSSDARSAR